MNYFDIMKEKIVDYKKDLEQKLREAFADMKREERVEVLNNVLNHLLALDFVQQMEYRLRMVFWKCNYHIYDFLRVQGQLSRDTGPIDQDVRNFLSDLIGKLADMNDQQGDERSAL